MDIIGLLHILILCASLVLGLFVFSNNRRRASNVIFLLLSLVLVAWLISIGIAFHTSTLVIAALAIRLANVCGAFLPFASHALCTAIVQRSQSPFKAIRDSSVWLGLALANSILCFTPFFLHEVRFSEAPLGVGIPEPVYGPGIILYTVFQVFSLAVFATRTIKGIRCEKGIVKLELQFVMLACAVGMTLGTISAILLPLVLNSSQVVRFAPVSVLPFLAIIAYGIATRRIMEVGAILRSITAYSLLTGYLAAVYVVVLYASRLLLRAIGSGDSEMPHFMAALAMSFNMVPAYGRMQHIARRLFVGASTTDVGQTVQRVSAILQSIGPMDGLLARFAAVTMESVGAAQMTILIEDRGRFRQAYPWIVDEGKISDGILDKDSALVELLSNSGRPLVFDMLHRRQPTSVQARAEKEMEGLSAAAAVRIMSKQSGLQGIILMGQRVSGRVYGYSEQRALQLVADQLSVAIENARLYTQIEDAKIYNESLLENLTCGVIAADRDGRITVFNREAGRVTDLKSDAMTGVAVDKLPRAFAQAFETTFNTRSGSALRDMWIDCNGDDNLIPIQIASSVFFDHSGEISGALIVFNDVSLVKKLETQVRRTAHLASVGTLSAGMAHEIKNPLVTLKTFSQLLGDKYDDPEFRDSFSSLVGKEVNRIDQIVNQLLKFGRPAKAEMVDISLREIMEQALQLVQVPVRKKRITVQSEWRTQNSQTAGDQRLLEQAFVNLFLNAIDAMDEGGELKVTLRQIHEGLPGADNLEDILPDRHLSVMITDTGAGIKDADLARVFDPFFTTKSTGTGLGLSVVHSIIQEHGGIIDVHSDPGEGTTFTILFPIHRSRSTTNNGQSVRNHTNNSKSNQATGKLQND